MSILAQLTDDGLIRILPRDGTSVWLSTGWNHFDSGGESLEETRLLTKAELLQLIAELQQVTNLM